MHFPHTLGIIAGGCQFTGHGMGIIPVYHILVSHTAVVLLPHAGMQCGPGRNTAGARGIGVIKQDSFCSDGIEIGRLDIGMSGDAQTIPPHLVGHDEDNVRW